MGIFFFIMLSIYTIILGVLSYMLYFRYIGQEERCSKKTIGIVKRPSTLRYGDTPIPLVIYEVDGRDYKIAGPRFKLGISKKISTPFGNPITEVESNLTTKDDLPDDLKVTTRGNTNIKITSSTLMTLFPVGSEVDVYYNPRKPKDAYVQRYVAPSKLFGYVPAFFAVICAIGAILMLF